MKEGTDRLARIQGILREGHVSEDPLVEERSSFRRINPRFRDQVVAPGRRGRISSFATAMNLPLRSLLTPKAPRILSVLLADPKRAWQVLDLAKEARVSLSLVSNVKKLLEERQIIQQES